MTEALDYPVAAPAGVEPAIFRAQIIQSMALCYLRHMRHDETFTQENAHDAAMATWETDWESDPEPRTIEAGMCEAEADLEYWYED